jgi:hypothetical protein
MALFGIETATFQLEARCLKQLRHSVSLENAPNPKFYNFLPAVTATQRTCKHVRRGDTNANYFIESLNEE